MQNRHYRLQDAANVHARLSPPKCAFSQPPPSSKPPYWSVERGSASQHALKHSFSAILFTQYHLGAIQPPAPIPTRRGRGSSLSKLFFTLFHFTTPQSTKQCRQHKQIAQHGHTVCFTCRCIQLAEFTAHPSCKSQALSISSFALAQRVPQQLKTLLKASFPLVDACPITVTRACIGLFLYNCILFAFAHNGALQHVQRLATEISSFSSSSSRCLASSKRRHRCCFARQPAASPIQLLVCFFLLRRAATSLGNRRASRLRNQNVMERAAPSPC